MKFTCDRSVLLKELGISQEILPGTGHLITILSNIYLEATGSDLIIRATDNNVYFETKVPVNVLESGKTTVPGSKLFAFLASVPDGEIEFSHEDQTMLIRPTTKKLKFQLRTISDDQFPEFQSFSSLTFFEIPVKQFKDMIKQTSFAVSDDPTRYHMNGVFLEKAEDKLVMVATDGRRLAFVENDGSSIEDFPAAIIPTKILDIITKNSGDEGLVSISISNKTIYIKVGTYNFYSVLFEGQFPNYKRVIPETQEHYFIVNKQDLMQAMKRVHLLVEKKSERIYFNLKQNSLVVYVDDSEMGNMSEEIDCSTDKTEESTFALKYSNLEEPLKVMPQEEVKVQFTDLAKAFTVSPNENVNFFHIMMPMQSDY
jgi:DNA polymerase-3 subunit beta